jgi:hypothetical protein
MLWTRLKAASQRFLNRRGLAWKDTTIQEVTVTETPAPESSPPPQAQQPAPASTYSPQEPPPPVHAGWAVASLLFFWPLAFSAFTHAFNVYPLWARGDAAGAQAASERVRRLGQLSLWLAGGLLLLFAIGYTMFVIALITQGYEGGHHFYHRGPGGEMPRGFDR